MDTEKRQHPRQFFDIKIRVGDTYGQTRNISMGGMSCTVTNEVPTMKLLDIIIYIDEEDAIKLQGTALRCTAVTKEFYDVGIYFYSPGMGQELRQKLADFLGVFLPEVPDPQEESK